MPRRPSASAQAWGHTPQTARPSWLTGLSPAHVAHHLEPLELHVVVERVDAGLALRDVHLLLRRVHALEVRQQQAALPPLRHDHAVARGVELVDRVDGHGGEQHVHRVRQRVQLVGAHGREPRVLGGRRHAVAHDLGCHAAGDRCDGADAAAQVAVLVQRHEHAGALVGQFGRQPVRQRDGASRAHEALDARAGQRHVRVDGRLVGSAVLGVRRVLALVDARPHRAVAGCALHLERRHGVAHAERPLVAEQLMRDREALQRARHDPERTQAALGGLVGELLVDVEQPVQVARVEQRRHRTVEHRALRRIAVRPLGRELVGQVAARDEHASAVQVGGRFGDAAPQGEVRLGRQARQADAHEPVARVRLVHEMERHEGGVVELAVAHAAAAQRHGVLARAGGDGGSHRAVVGHGDGRVPRPEPPHVAVARLAGGHVEAVAEQRRVRRDHHDGVGRVRGDAARHLAVGVDGVLDGALLPAAHLGHDERRMRHGVRGDDSHEGSLPRR